MKSWLKVLGAAALVGAVLSGCGGSDGSAGPTGATGATGATGPAGPAGPPGPAGSAAIVLTPTTPPEVWANLDMVGTVTSVTIASPPVVNFKLATKQGVPVIGFGTNTNFNTSTQTVASYPNVAFSLAKLIPGSGGQPSRWVSYIVTTVPSKTASSTCAANAVCLTRPSTDNTGKLVDNKDGSYTYTFYRDIPGSPNATPPSPSIKAQVDAITPPANTSTANYDKAKLDDLTYDPALTHRLTIQISGNAPGTGTNTPDGSNSGVTALPLKNAVDVVYDFVPATGQPPAASAQRNITTTSNCNNCHNTLGGIPGGDPESNAAGFHGGSRNNVQYCVVCHTGQRSWGRVEAPYDPNTLTFLPSGTPPAVTTYMVDGKAVGNLVNMIHKTHLGKFLARKNYNYAEVEFNEVGYPQDTRNCQNCHSAATTAQAAVTPQGDNWKTAPSRLACGACHDGINFDTGGGVTLADAWAGKTVSTGFNGKAHPANATDAGCTNAGCHGVENGVNKIDLAHLPVTPPSAQNSLLLGGTNANTNAAWIASGVSANRLPAGAITVTYDVKEVGRNGLKQPYIIFRMLQNGARKDLNAFTGCTPNSLTATCELWDNFMGSPSVYFVWAVPQDGVSYVQDFNVSASGWLKSIWNNTATGGGVGTLSAPDSNGYYTVTLTNLVVADNATMLTGGVGYTYSLNNALPLTQMDVPGYPTAAYTAVPPPLPGQSTMPPTSFRTGGLIVIAPNKQLVASKGCPTANGNAEQCVLTGSSTGAYLGRRAIVSDSKCNACHQELGAFTEDAFHSGQRNDGSTCSWCHRPNQTSTGWSADSTAFVHAIHGAAKRTKPYTWHSISATENFSEVTYPGVLANCMQCHLDDTYNWGTSAAQNAVGLGASSDGKDKRLLRTVGAGYYSGTVGGTLRLFTGAACTPYTSAATTAAGVASMSSYVGSPVADASGDAATANTGTYYGNGFAYNARSTAQNACLPNSTVQSLAAAGTAGDTLQASSQTIVMSPTVSVCTGCHDSNLALSHMAVNGGTFYETRAAAGTKTEQCLVCHSKGRTADTEVVHTVK